MSDKQAKLATALRKRPSDDDVPPPLVPTRGPEEVKLRKSNLKGTTSWEQCLALLELNLKHEYAVCVETVTKMLTNITSNPSEPKFRKIRVPTSSRILSHRRRGHERAARPLARPRGAGAPHRVPHPAPQPTPSQTSRSGALGRAESRAKGGERRPPHPRPPTERTGPARAPRSASRIPPSKIWNRWRGAALTRTSFVGSFVCRAPSMGQRSRENDDTPAPPHARRAHRGPRGRPPCLVDPTFTKSGKVGKGS